MNIHNHLVNDISVTFGQTSTSVMLDIANVMTQKPVLLWSVERRDPWFTWESWLNVTLMKGSAQMGYRSFFLSLLWKISVSEMNPSTLWGPKRRSEPCSLHSPQHGQIHVVKASRGISNVMARTGWNGQTELQTVLRRTLHMSNLWCLNRGRNHRLNCSYHKQKWQHFLILQLLSSLSKKVLYRTAASQNTHLLFSFQGPDIFLPFTFIFSFISICLANL